MRDVSQLDSEIRGYIHLACRTLTLKPYIPANFTDEQGKPEQQST